MIFGELTKYCRTNNYNLKSAIKQGTTRNMNQIAKFADQPFSRLKIKIKNRNGNNQRWLNWKDTCCKFILNIIKIISFSGFNTKLDDSLLQINQFDLFGE